MNDHNDVQDLTFSIISYVYKDCDRISDRIEIHPFHRQREIQI